MNLKQKKLGLVSIITLTKIGLIGNSIVIFILTRPKFLIVSFFGF
jgi:hypothetical protein